MKKKRKPVPTTKKELYSGVASANECTGLTASVPLDESEAESYREIEDVPVTSEKTLKRCRGDH